MKTVIAIFCIAGVAVGWMATHLSSPARIIRDPGLPLPPLETQKEPVLLKPHEVPVKAENHSGRSRE